MWPGKLRWRSRMAESESPPKHLMNDNDYDDGNDRLQDVYVGADRQHSLLNPFIIIANCGSLWQSPSIRTRDSTDQYI